MVVVEHNSIYGWKGYLDGYLKRNMDEAKRVIKKDWDMIFIIDGYEGSGKSVLAQQVAKFCDSEFNVDRVCFTPEQFIKVVTNCPKFGAIVFDEAMTGLSSRAAMSEINRMLVAVLAEIRQKNLFVLIVMPCFFEMDKYAAVWRSRALFHVYTGKNMERGFFSFYGQDKKKDLYVFGKKFYSYKQVKPNFRGRFTKGYTIDEDIYRAKKYEALKNRERKSEGTIPPRYRKWKDQRNIMIKLIKDMGWTNEKIGQVLE